METLKAIGGFLFIISIIGLLFMVWCPLEWFWTLAKIELSLYIIIGLIFIFDKATDKNAD